MTRETSAVVPRKKLIEVALPLDPINRASAREKSIRHGHPSTLHLWWARRPLAAARAVIFAQMVDDPSSNPDLFRTQRAQEKERQRLFRIIEDLVKWESTTNEEVLQRARDEIWQSWRRACADNADHPRAKELFNRHVLPAFHDPFAGGGSLPLEAQRLGLEAHASDLNPVAVLINKAMIEIPPRFAARPPINPAARGEKRLMNRNWRGAQGLAEDVRYYGQWMRDEAEKRIGHLYPKVHVSERIAQGRPDLEPYVGRDLTVIAWLWARTVKSPNPAFADVDVPLATTFILSKKKGKEAYIEPVIEEDGYRFTVKVGTPPDRAGKGTKVGRASFVCLVSGSPIPSDYIKSEGRAGRMGARLMAIVAEGDRRRLYLGPTNHQTAVAKAARPSWRPTLRMPKNPRWFSPPLYGLDSYGALFADRQLVALTTLSDLVAEARERVQGDAVAADLKDDDALLRDGGTGATAYAEAMDLYLALVVSKTADSGCTIARWQSSGDFVAGAFARQALPMMWDFAEANVFSTSTQNWMAQTEWVAKAVERLPSSASSGKAFQDDATSLGTTASSKPSANVRIVSTDPPYYDNIGYADLSDFFYVWLRRSLRSTFPELFATLAVPKLQELVATPHRHGTRANADRFFLDGMTRVLRRLSVQTHPTVPVTIFYAFKQTEVTESGGTRSGWETFLDAVIRAGFAITGTWPIRTERGARVLAIGTNALASSIVLACRPREADASAATRREFQDSLRTELPQALDHLRRSNIAPVDLAQASIGPGMAVFTRYRHVLNADGSRMSVGDALALINATLDEVLAEPEGDFDPDTRWALTWFEQHGFSEGEYGVAEQLSKSKNTSVEGLVRAGVVASSRGAVRLLEPDELDPDWEPAADRRLTVWEMTHYLIRELAVGEENAAELVAALGSQAEIARDLAYRLYTISERRQRAADALRYNSLVQSWPEILRLAGHKLSAARQAAFALDEA